MRPELPTLSPLIWIIALQFLLYAAGWGLCSILIREERRAITHWGLFMLFIGLGFLFSAMRREPRTFIPYVGCNIAFIAGYIALGRGLECYVRIQPADRLYAILFSLSSLTLILLGPAAVHAWLRVIVAYMMGTVIVGLAIKRVAKQVILITGRRMFIVYVLPAVLLVIVFLSRSIMQAVDPSHAFEMQLDNENNRSALLVYLIGAAMFNFSFVGLVTTQLLQRLRDQVRRDALTGLPNRRALEEVLQQEWQRFQLSGQGFAVLALDLDYFKRVNDTYGHLIGDAVLQETGRRLLATVRHSDVVVRTGGEEFVVMLPNATWEGALAQAERLRRAVVERPFALSDFTLAITLSVGVTLAYQRDTALHQVLHRADRALYRAKAEGRDRIVQLDGHLMDGQWQ